MNEALAVAALLFVIGAVGVLARRNLFFVLMSIEVMLAATTLAFVAAGSAHGAPDGQIVALLILIMAAAETAVGLALLLVIRRRLGTIDADQISTLRG